VSTSLAVLLAACAPTPEELPAPRAYPAAPGQDEALAAVWAVLLGADADPPTIEWVAGEPCPDDYRPGLPPSILVPTGAGVMCAPGTYRRYEVRLVVPVPTPGASVPFGRFSSSAFVHELVHAHLDMTFGSADEGHTEHPEAWPLVTAGNAALRELGL
jgi:hypothetical protein